MSEAENKEEAEKPEQEATTQVVAEEDTKAKYEAEIAQLKDAYLRAMAETENVRARAKRENEDTAKYATTKFARDMVNVYENLVRASQSISVEARSSNDMIKLVGDGIDMTINELSGIFERNGIKRIDPLGEKFDHTFHQAVTQVESADKAPGTILQVLQAGYVLHDRLLRPAMVVVTKEASNSNANDNAA